VLKVAAMLQSIARLDTTKADEEEAFFFPRK
jgi:hypothetical protein